MKPCEWSVPFTSHFVPRLTDLTSPPLQPGSPFQASHPSLIHTSCSLSAPALLSPLPHPCLFCATVTSSFSLHTHSLLIASLLCILTLPPLCPVLALQPPLILTAALSLPSCLHFLPHPPTCVVRSHLRPYRSYHVTSPGTILFLHCLNRDGGTSLVVQWLRPYLPLQVVQV